MQESLVQKIVDEVLQQVLNQTTLEKDLKIPIGVSARHVHLTHADIERLFGQGYQLSSKFELSQPGQFAAEETVIIAGPKGTIEKVRILGPARAQSQVEISWTDAIKIGLNPPLRQSGDVKGSSAVTLIGPKGSILLPEGLIIAQAHIHMSPNDCDRLQVVDGQIVQVELQGKRPIILSNVIVRVSERFCLEMHIDTDEANAGLIKQGMFAEILSPNKMKSTLVESTQPVNVLVPEKKSVLAFEKKLLSQADIMAISEDEIIITKKTIVTALAYDKVRELNKTITIRT